MNVSYTYVCHRVELVQ